MKARRIMTYGLVLTLAASMLTALTGCTAANATDLMAGIERNHVDVAADLRAGSAAVTGFGVRLFQASADGEQNALISPLSVLCALAMTANGADGRTLSEMEAVLGMPVEELNAYLHAYMAQLPETDTCKLSLANSIWLNDDGAFHVNGEFLQTNADYYGAGIYRTPFDDSARIAINNWVKEHTDGMIEEILREIPAEAVMYLVNALAFDAEWQVIYGDHQVRDGVFTREDGVEQAVEMMHSQEHRYLEDENATGFIKYYKNRAYAFLALLPNEGVSVLDYVSSLTGERLYSMITSPIEAEVIAAIPKFECEYGADMTGMLQSLGMADAFDMEAADFSGIGSHDAGNILISRVLHKTYIAVDEKGTKAGAATVVEGASGAAAPEHELKTVILDRPFVYMLIDCANGLPFFMGTAMDMAG